MCAMQLRIPAWQPLLGSRCSDSSSTRLPSPFTHYLACSCEWDDPFGGRCTDTFSLSNCGLVLTQLTDMSIAATGRRTLYK